MKKLILAFSFVMGGMVAVNAQDTTSTQTQTQQYPTTTQSTGLEDQDRERINSRDLPDAVKRSLEGTEYRGWLVNAAYKTSGVSGSSMQGDASTMGADSVSMRSETQGSQGTQSSQGSQGSQSDTTSVSGNAGTGAYGQEVFVVELKNGAQTKTVRFDKDGNKLDDGTEDDQDQK